MTGEVLRSIRFFLAPRLGELIREAALGTTSQCFERLAR